MQNNVWRNFTTVSTAMSLEIKDITNKLSFININGWKTVNLNILKVSSKKKFWNKLETENFDLLKTYNFI